MSVIKLVNELIGKEDVNWGDSSSTFSRETYTGGSTDIHYIDAEIIPSTTLGGYIGDHLHEQNTDTGTTGSTFTIDSDSNAAILSTSGLTADRTFTFPNTSNQALVGATDLASIAAGYGASRVGVQDSGTYFSGATVEAVLAEIGADITTLEGTTHNSGMKIGFKLGYSSTTAITIGAGIWAHNGTSNQHVYTASQITFTLGPAGSNASSSNLGANELHYIYIDDSAVVSAATRLLTATEFVSSTVVPSWSHAKVGWYNGNDRCIGAVLTDASNHVLDFDIFSKHFYRYATPIVEFSYAAAGTTYASLTLNSSIPAFATMSRLQIYTGTSDTAYYFDNASTGTTPEAHCITGVRTLDVPTSSAQVVYWYAGAASNTAIYTTGYYIEEL